MARKIKYPGRMGRPPIPYNDDVANQICVLISTTTWSLKKICKKKKSFPSPSVVYGWMLRNEEFQRKYACAKQRQAEALADQIIELADKVRIGEVIKTNNKGFKEKRIVDMVDRARLQIDTRKWVLAHLLPDRYGDKIQIDPGKDTLQDLFAGLNNISKQLGRPEGMTEQPEEEAEKQE